jgi:4'-phosphopantetheinyl transferase
VPIDNRWLSDAEALRLDKFRVEKRRKDWRLGRWTAKCALLRSGFLGSCSLAEIEILPTESGAPEVLLHNRPVALSISLSHRAGIAVCALSRSGVALGCDLELIEPRSDAFIADYFAAEEQELVSRATTEMRWLTVALIWSGKESALKATHTGLRIDTRRVMVHFDDECLTEDNHSDDLHWHPLHSTHEDKQVFYGWWQASGDLVKTMVSFPSQTPRILLTRQ